jgi:leucyl/phenylalanyl-tRNA---protein transferase
LRQHKASKLFPDALELPEGESLLAVSDHIDTTLLKEAYAHGIFPFPQDDSGIIPWVSLDPRGVLGFEQFRISRSTEKAIRSAGFSFTFNRNFQDVIHQCRTIQRSDQKGSWITQALVDGYVDLHHEGHALSIEVWNADVLVGGLYGVWMKGVFSGESMFHLQDNASKAALIFLHFILEKNNARWIDTQMITPTIAAFGGIEISRIDYYTLLRSTQKPSKRIHFPGIWTYNRDGVFIQGPNSTR